MSKETLLGYVILFIGVVVGWLLRGLWRSAMERRSSKTIFLSIEHARTAFRKLADVLKKNNTDTECTDEGERWVRKY